MKERNRRLSSSVYRCHPSTSGGLGSETTKLEVVRRRGEAPKEQSAVTLHREECASDSVFLYELLINKIVRDFTFKGVCVTAVKKPYIIWLRLSITRATGLLSSRSGLRCTDRKLTA